MTHERLEETDRPKECEEAVIDKIRSRRNVGRAKYGQTMERQDLSEDQWLQHAQEEALDLAIYLERLMRPVTNPTVEFKQPVMKADGCHLEMWSGVVGITDSLEVVELTPAKNMTIVCERNQLPQSERIALANRMIKLWKYFAAD